MILGIHLMKRGRTPRDFDLWEVAGKTEGFSGAELEACVTSALYDAFDDSGRPVATADLVRAVGETTPISRSMRSQLEGLRAWAKTYARPASTHALREATLGTQSVSL